jgi:hypothetical protein
MDLVLYNSSIVKHAQEQKSFTTILCKMGAIHGQESYDCNITTRGQTSNEAKESSMILFM